MGLLLRLLLLVGIVALSTALPDVFIETFPLEIMLYNQKTTNISTFDGLTYPFYFANDDGLMTLYQSNQWTISLGKENSLMDFKSFRQPQKSVVGLERNMDVSRFDMCGSWLISIEHVPERNMYVAFYHGENRCDLGDTFLCSYSAGVESLKQMGLAYSTDGKSWVKPESNAIISSVNGRAGDGAYFKVSVFPNYRFMLYVQDGSTCIARAAYACISEPSCWKKYYQGAWSSAGIDGACDTIGAPPTVFQQNTQKYVVEFAHYDGNYLMAVEISQYGGTHTYITKSTNPQGPWEPYGSPILYQGAFKNPSRITSATVIAEGYLGDNQVIPQGHEISIMYTLSTSNKGDSESQRESLIIRQPIKIWGPSTWLGVSLNPIRTYMLSVNNVPFSWTTNLVYSPIADIVDDYQLGYVATQPVSGATNMGLLYSCLIPIGHSSNPSQTTMITDINFLYGRINPLTPSPECPNAGWTSQYIGYVFWSKPSKYTTQQIDKCMMTGSYTMQFSFLANHSTTNPCYGIGTPVTSFWVFVNSNGY